MKNIVATDVICPFYHAEDRQKLYCEGVADNCSLHIAFFSPSAKKRYRTNRCTTWDWSRCRVARMLNERWLEEAGVPPEQ